MTVVRLKQDWLSFNTGEVLSVILTVSRYQRGRSFQMTEKLQSNLIQTFAPAKYFHNYKIDREYFLLIFFIYLSSFFLSFFQLISFSFDSTYCVLFFSIIPFFSSFILFVCLFVSFFLSLNLIYDKRKKSLTIQLLSFLELI